MNQMKSLKVFGMACLCGGLAYTAFAGAGTEEAKPKVVEVKVACQPADGEMTKTHEVLINKELDLEKIREQLKKDFSEEEVNEMMAKLESATQNIKLVQMECDVQKVVREEIGDNVDADVDVETEKTFIIKSQDGDQPVKRYGVMRVVDADGNETVRELSDAEMEERVVVKSFPSGENMELTCKSVGEDGEAKVGVFVYKTDGEKFDVVEINNEAKEFVYEVLVKSEDGETTLQKRMVVISDVMTCSKPMEAEEQAPVQQEMLYKEGEGRLMVENLSLFPNPSDGVFTLNFDLPETEEPVIINIVDVLGSKIYTETLDNFTGSYSNTIDLRSDARGHYILNITQGDKIISKNIELK